MNNKNFTKIKLRFSWIKMKRDFIRFLKRNSKMKALARRIRKNIYFINHSNRPAFLISNRKHLTGDLL